MQGTESECSYGWSIQPIPWGHSVLPELWTCEGKKSFKGLLRVFCMIRALFWWPCLTSFYAYQALHQMLTWLHPQYLLVFLHGNASSFPNVCILLTKAVGFIFKSLPLHFLHVLFCWTLMTEGHMILFLPFYKLCLSFLLSSYYLQFKENVQHPGRFVAG